MCDCPSCVFLAQIPDEPRRPNPVDEPSIRCATCGGVAHPATGCVYTPTFITCGQCTRRMWVWMRQHTNAKGRKKGPNFYEHVTHVRRDESLPDDPWRYFTPEPGVVLVEVEKLETTRARAGGIERAEGHMRAAYDGKGAMRGPIHVTPRGMGWQVEDGNSTVAVARKNGWRLLPALVVANTQGDHS